MAAQTPMSLSDIQSREPVLQAIAEFDKLGRDEFLRRHGFGESRQYFLRHSGRLYDSKAIIGVARGYARPDLGPLRAADFTGGENTVQRKLEDLGFEVVIEGAATASRTSLALQPGKLYSRADLKQMFEITDSTINNGIFHPKATASVWLFVTESKSADRTQYEDLLDGDTLRWQGQTEGRTDALVIEHARRGLELLLFYRHRKNEHPGGGFRYEGPFRYESHAGSRPTSFVLQRDVAALLEREGERATREAEAQQAFDPTGVADARHKTMAAIVRRRGQPRFRAELLVAYEGRCAISACDIAEVLEAAHIHPYRGDETNHVTNGILLRADLHTLFDLGKLAIHEADLTVILADDLKASEYGRLHGQAIAKPADPRKQPSRAALAKHRQDSGL